MHVAISSAKNLYNKTVNMSGQNALPCSVSASASTNSERSFIHMKSTLSMIALFSGALFVVVLGYWIILDQSQLSAVIDSSQPQPVTVRQASVNAQSNSPKPKSQTPPSSLSSALTSVPAASGTCVTRKWKKRSLTGSGAGSPHVRSGHAGGKVPYKRSKHRLSLRRSSQSTTSKSSNASQGESWLPKGAIAYINEGKELPIGTPATFDNKLLSELRGSAYNKTLRLTVSSPRTDLDVISETGYRDMIAIMDRWSRSGRSRVRYSDAIREILSRKPNRPTELREMLASFSKQDYDYLDRITGIELNLGISAIDRQFLIKIHLMAIGLYWQDKNHAPAGDVFRWYSRQWFTDLFP